MALLMKKFAPAVAAIPLMIGSVGNYAYAGEASNSNNDSERSVSNEANEGESTRRLSRGERNVMARHMDIANNERSYGFLMDDNSSDDGLYLILMDFKNDSVPADAVQREINRFKDNAIVILSPYITKEGQVAATRAYEERKALEEDRAPLPVEGALIDQAREREKRAYESRQFASKAAAVIAQRSATNVVLIEVKCDPNTFLEEYQNIINRDVAIELNDPTINLTEDAGPLFVAGGIVYIPGNDIPAVIFHEYSGSTQMERDNKSMGKIGTAIHTYDGSFPDLVVLREEADASQKAPEIALNKD